MYYAIFVPSFLPEENLIFTEIKEASKVLKKFHGSRMKTFRSKEEALDYVTNGDESFFEDSTQDLVESLEKLNINNKNDGGDKEKGDQGEKFPSVEPGALNKLRKSIEAGDYEEVEKTIWSNPRCLVTVCDSAVYLQAGPKYNACHIAARANKSEILALILDTITNFSFIKKLYPNEPDANIQARVTHLLDSYLNTPDPRGGNTPLHFACKKGFHKVVRVLLTFEGCDLNLKDSTGQTAEESITSESQAKIKDLFKGHLYLPLHRDQLKKRLILEKRRSTGTP